jgi:hypothetical protein
MKTRFTEEQIIVFLRKADAGLKIKDLCCKHGFSEPSYYAWKAKFGGINAFQPQSTIEFNSRLGPVPTCLSLLWMLGSKRNVHHRKSPKLIGIQNRFRTCRLLLDVDS